MQEKTILQKLFIFAAALAICVLLVLDTVALVQKFGSEKAKEIVGSVAPPSTGAASTTPEAAQSNSAATDGFLSAIVDDVTKKDTPAPETFLLGAYYHELGEYGYGNTMLIPTILFSPENVFVFSENTGSGMGNCSGTYQLSDGGTTLTCYVTAADIACPDIITFLVAQDNAIVLQTDMKKSISGDSFILRLPEE